MRFLCIFAMPRTGSGLLNALLNSCPEITAKSELFHRRGGAKLTERDDAALCAAAGEPLPGMASNTWRRKHPMRSLEVLYEAGNRKVLAFKIFHSHLPRPRIEAEFFPQKDMAFAVLRRRPIESFISAVKAKSLERFRVVDTTSIKPAISTDEFVAWIAVAKEWYEWVDGALAARGLPCADISYEKHLKGRSGGEALSDVLALLKSTGLSGIPLPGQIRERQMQDKEPRYQDRVANWDEFFAAAQPDPRCRSLLEWAQQVP